MNIIVQEDSSCTEPEIIIRCGQADAAIFQMLAVLRTFDRKLTGIREGRVFVVDASDVFYFESVDKKTFLYTDSEVMETPLRLYELEERLSGGSFFRASKSLIINITRIASLKPEFSGKLEVTLVNGERLHVSRQYVPELRKRLEL